MNATSQIAKHFREIHFGGNWTVSNLKEHLSDLTWQEATKQVYGLNSLAALTFHMNYFVSAALKVLQGKPLDAHDKFSFEVPLIQSQADWEKLLDKTFTEAEQFAALVEPLPEHKLWEDFTDKKYGNYYRNLHGIIEHCHYHLGQVVLVKKLIKLKDGD